MHWPLQCIALSLLSPAVLVIRAFLVPFSNSIQEIPLSTPPFIPRLLGPPRSEKNGPTALHVGTVRRPDRVESDVRLQHHYRIADVDALERLRRVRPKRVFTAFPSCVFAYHPIGWSNSFLTSLASGMAHNASSSQHHHEKLPRGVPICDVRYPSNTPSP